MTYAHNNAFGPAVSVHQINALNANTAIYCKTNNAYLITPAIPTARSALQAHTAKMMEAA